MKQKNVFQELRITGTTSLIHETPLSQLHIYIYIYTGFVLVLENLASPGILLRHIAGLSSPGKLESFGNLLNSSNKLKCTGRR